MIVYIKFEGLQGKNYRNLGLMYISELKLWNFRKYGKTEWNLENPHLVVPFKDGINVLIGENDSGKTAIIDAIKLVLKTHAFEWIKVEDEDFYETSNEKSNKLRIEILFDDIKGEEAKNFTEWLGWNGEGVNAKPILRLILQAERKNDKILPYDVRAGMDGVGHQLNAEAREYLKATYLRALRDADSELVAKKNSRLSQILQGHELFKEKDGEEHKFVKWFNKVNENIKTWFNDDTGGENGSSSNKKQIKDIVDAFLHDFIGDSISSDLKLAEPEIKAILEKISLETTGNNLGLGTMNRLYMAIELLHLRKDWDGLKLGLIEELEAHLHPQAQMKVITALQKEKVQFILSTHSPNLASKVDLGNIIICNGNNVFPLANGMTKLEPKNYKYLKRFLDVTKSNLFFAKGVIIVEGWAEEILIPALAEKLGCDLAKHEVSIVNVGSTAYLHFAKIFLRNDGKMINIPVSVVTDLDVRPEQGIFNTQEETKAKTAIQTDFNDFNGTPVQLYIAKRWTLEWCLFKSTLSNIFRESVAEIHSETNQFKKDENGIFKTEFETILIEKLAKSKGTSALDKVAVANVLAEKILKPETQISQSDEYIKYLIDAIKHACRQ